MIRLIGMRPWQKRIFEMNIFDLFFVYGSELPENVGFPMYGIAHILWLAVGVVLTVLLAILYRRKSEKTRRRMDLWIGSFLLFCIVIRDIYLLIVGYLTIYELPFHLCTMAGILGFIHSIKRADWIGQVLYALCLPGTLVALTFPDWIYYPPIHFITMQGFLYHFGVALYVLCQLISKRIRPDIRKIWKVYLFLLIIAVPIYFFNKKLGTNYLFINVPSAGSPLEWIADFMGNPGYLIGFGILTVVGTCLMDLGFMLASWIFNKVKGYPDKAG